MGFYLSKKGLLLKSLIYRVAVIIYELLLAYFATGGWIPALTGYFNQAILLIILINGSKVLGLWVVDLWWFHWGKPLLRRVRSWLTRKS